MHHIWKILFILGADEYLERLEGKIRKCLFFYVKIFWNNSVTLDFGQKWSIQVNHLQIPSHILVWLMEMEREPLIKIKLPDKICILTENSTTKIMTAAAQY